MTNQNTAQTIAAAPANAPKDDAAAGQQAQKTEGESKAEPKTETAPSSKT